MADSLRLRVASHTTPLISTGNSATSHGHIVHRSRGDSGTPNCSQLWRTCQTWRTVTPLTSSASAHATALPTAVVTASRRLEPLDHTAATNAKIATDNPAVGCIKIAAKVLLQISHRHGRVAFAAGASRAVEAGLPADCPSEPDCPSDSAQPHAANVVSSITIPYGRASVPKNNAFDSTANIPPARRPITRRPVKRVAAITNRPPVAATASTDGSLSSSS